MYILRNARRLFSIKIGLYHLFPINILNNVMEHITRYFIIYLLLVCSTWKIEILIAAKDIIGKKKRDKRKKNT